MLLAAVSDVTVTVDDKGVVAAVQSNTAEPPREVAASWVGRPFIDSVTNETRGKVEALLRDAGMAKAISRRQVNHPGPDGTDYPVSYAAVRLGDGSGTLLLGREESMASALQGRLVEAQQEMERSYWRLRHTETRYRQLFHHSAEAVLVVDATTSVVTEANAAAGHLFKATSESLVNRPFPFGVDADAAAALSDAVAAARMTGTLRETSVSLRDGRRLLASVSCFRQEAATLAFVRFIDATGTGITEGERRQRLTMSLIESVPDAFLLVNAEGTVLRTNQAFLDLAEMASREAVVGRQLSDWIGRPGADWAVMSATLREHKILRSLQTSLQGRFGASAEVEISGAAISEGNETYFLFVVREVARRLLGAPKGAADLTRAVEQLTGLVGRVQLKDLLKDTIALVERHFVEAALETTGNNRSAAAELLGLSRQSFYIKLRRYRLLTADAR
jgi:transcriptional regulator PpsR